MLKIFYKRKPVITDIEIPSFGWAINQDTAEIKQWINTEQTMAVSINFFNSKPDLPSLKDIKVLRNYYRNQLLQANGGLIQTDVISINGFACIKTIFKIQPEDAGITYLLSLTIPFESFSYVIKIQAPEIGITGMRTSLIADRLLKENVISVSDSGYNGWSADPYDAAIKEGNLMNLSESAVYDSEFPSHPLSVSRKLMTDIESEIVFKDVLQKLPQFSK